MTSDLQVRDDVVAELAWDPSVHEVEIDVGVKRGVVTLTGTVCSYPEKWGADSAALRVRGVKALVSMLKVALTPPQVREDAAVQRAAQAALAWSVALAGSDVTARVDAGWVTLAGSVLSQYQRSAAEHAVRHLTGVIGVTDAITLAATPIPGSVHGDIEEALKRAAAADAQNIRVAVDGTVVTLSGSVRSWAQAAAAANAAWSCPGVTQVVDALAVVD
jgi:osmotically-inducible protein OsmY